VQLVGIGPSTGFGGVIATIDELSAASVDCNSMSVAFSSEQEKPKRI
jgi:hypothetical protein